MALPRGQSSQGGRREDGGGDRQAGTLLPLQGSMQRSGLQVLQKGPWPAGHAYATSQRDRGSSHRCELSDAPRREGAGSPGRKPQGPGGPGVQGQATGDGAGAGHVPRPRLPVINPDT